MLLGLQIYFFFLTLQKWRKIKGRNTSRGEQATFQILEKGLSSWRRGLFLWIWRKGPIPNFQMKHLLISSLCKMETLPLGQAHLQCDCGLLQKAEGQGVTGMWGENPKVHWVPSQERTIHIHNSLFPLCWKHKHNLLTPQQAKGSRSPSQEPFRNTALSCFHMYTEVHHDVHGLCESNKIRQIVDNSADFSLLYMQRWRENTAWRETAT